jgi:hypothetical protein
MEVTNNSKAWRKQITEKKDEVRVGLTAQTPYIEGRFADEDVWGR